MATKKRSTRRARLLARARAGDAEAQAELGWDFFWRRPIRKRLAVSWWREAAHAGVVEAQVNLASCYYEGAGVRRVSTGGSLARAAYGALMAGTRELLADGTSRYAAGGISNDVLAAAFGQCEGGA